MKPYTGHAALPDSRNALRTILARLWHDTSVMPQNYCTFKSYPTQPLLLAQGQCACSCASRIIYPDILLATPRCPPCSALLRAAVALATQLAVAFCDAGIPGAQATSSLPLPLKGFFSCVLSSEKVWLTCEWQASSARTASTTCAQVVSAL